MYIYIYILYTAALFHCSCPCALDIHVFPPFFLCIFVCVHVSNWVTHNLSVHTHYFLDAATVPAGSPERGRDAHHARFRDFCLRSRCTVGRLAR